MKMIFAVLMFVAANADAGYLRFMDHRDGAFHPSPLLGGFLDPATVGNSDGGALLPLLTHSARLDPATGKPADGCLLPSIACEDWSPLAIGGSFNAGKARIAIGPVINVLPVFQNLTLALLDLWGKDTLPGLRSALKPTQSKDKIDIRISIAPVFEYDPFYQASPGNMNGHGYFRIFTGPQVLF